MYNQLIKQSDSISKICRDIKESFSTNISCRQKYQIDYSTHAMHMCMKAFSIRYEVH
jgi:hypothetical protein